MPDETTMPTKEEYLALDETARMRVRLLAARRALLASDEAMRGHQSAPTVGEIAASAELPEATVEKVLEARQNLVKG